MGQVKWLYAAKDKYETSILNYVVTSNHIHLLILASDNREEIPRTMQLVASRKGFEYNRRKNRKGAFWEKRYTATAVQKDEHLIRCSLYIDVNMGASWSGQTSKVLETRRIQRDRQAKAKIPADRSYVIVQSGQL